jgi:hypothetical protein
MLLLSSRSVGNLHTSRSKPALAVSSQLSSSNCVNSETGVDIDRELSYGDVGAVAKSLDPLYSEVLYSILRRLLA